MKAAFLLLISLFIGCETRGVYVSDAALGQSVGFQDGVVGRICRSRGIGLQSVQSGISLQDYGAIKSAIRDPQYEECWHKLIRSIIYTESPDALKFLYDFVTKDVSGNISGNQSLIKAVHVSMASIGGGICFSDNTVEKREMLQFLKDATIPSFWESSGIPWFIDSQYGESQNAAMSKMALGGIMRSCTKDGLDFISELQSKPERVEQFGAFSLQQTYREALIRFNKQHPQPTMLDL